MAVPGPVLPTVEPNAPGPQYQQADRYALAGGFGVQVSDALQNLGQEGQHLSAEVGAIHTQDVDRQAKTADAAYANAQTLLLMGDGTPQNPGFKNLQGENALSAQAGVQKSLDKQRDQIAASITDPQARDMFLQAAASRDATFNGEVSVHVTNQRNVANKAADMGRIDQAKQDVTTFYDNPDVYARSLAITAASIDSIALAEGWKQDEITAAKNKAAQDLFDTRAKATQDALMGLDPKERLKHLGGPSTPDANGSIAFTPESVHRVEGSGTNPKSGAVGDLQITKDTGDTYAPGKDLNDPGVQKQVFLAKSAIDASMLRQTLGREPTPPEQYVAWQQGTGGAQALFSADPSANAFDVLKAAYNGNSVKAHDAIVNNGGNLGGTVGDLIDHVEKQYTAKNPATPATGPHDVATGSDLPLPADALAHQLAPDTLQAMKQSTENEIYTAQQRAAAAQEKALAGKRADLTQQIGDDYAAILDTGSPVSGKLPPSARDMADAGFTPREIIHYSGLLQKAQDSWTIRSQMAFSTPDEDAALLAKTQPSGEGYAEQVQMRDLAIKAVTDKQNALKNDPAAYVVKQAGLQQELLDAINDPSKMGTFEAQLGSYYDKLGTPANAREILPKQVAQQLVQNVVGQPAAQRADTLVQMAQKFGPEWGAIQGSMVRAGLPTAYELITAIPDPSMRRLLSDGLTDPTAPGKVIGPAAEGEITKQIDEDSNFLALSASLGYSPAGTAKAGEIHQGIELMAKMLLARDGNRDVAGAVNKAVSALTIDKYDFTDNFARVPKGQLANVVAAQRNILDTLLPGDLQPLTHVGPAAPDNAQLQQLALQNAKNGQWVTNERDTGMFLVDPLGRPVMIAGRGQAERLEFSFDNLPDAPVLPGGGAHGFRGLR